MQDRRSTLAWLGVALSAVAQGALAEERSIRPALDILQSAPTRVQEFLARHLGNDRRDRPDWVLEQSNDTLDPQLRFDEKIAQVVVQQDRRDGTDLLTLRYPLVGHGAWRTYAGAGFNQAVYFESDSVEPALMSRRNRDRSLGAAAELGAEYRMSERLLLQADVRWADLADEAVLLRSNDGLVSADTVSLAVSVGWHFR